MCGRYNLITDAQALVDFFDVDTALIDLAAFHARYNIAPSQYIPAVRQGEQGRELVALRWGLIPAWSKEAKTTYSMINARAETVADKPAYRDAFRQRRCLIPATGFYEWKGASGNRQPYFIGMRGQGLLAFAGLWERWQGGDENSIESCSIIVTNANDAVRPVHDRMPVILARSDYEQWLDPANKAPESLMYLLQPCEAQAMMVYPVSSLVNSPANDGPRCVERQKSGDELF